MLPAESSAFLSKTAGLLLLLISPFFLMIRLLTSVVRPLSLSPSVIPLPESLRNFEYYSRTAEDPAAEPSDVGREGQSPL
jgi:hypothetical protein